MCNILQILERKVHHTHACGTAMQLYKKHSIRKYGSTFYIGIAMVVLPYFGPWEN